MYKWIKNWLINFQPLISILNKSLKKVWGFTKFCSREPSKKSSSEDFQVVYIKNIHAKLILFVFLMISKVRNIVSIRKLRTFWKSAKYQRVYFNSRNFTQKPNVWGIVKTSFLKVLKKSLPSKGIEDAEMESGIVQTAFFCLFFLFFLQEKKNTHKRKSYCQISAT